MQFSISKFIIVRPIYIQIRCRFIVIFYIEKKIHLRHYYLYTLIILCSVKQ